MSLWILRDMFSRINAQNFKYNIKSTRLNKNVLESNKVNPE